MPNTYGQGRLERYYIGQESAYGTPAVITAAKAVRTTLGGHLNFSPRNRVNSPERIATHPSQITRFTRRTTGDFALNSIFFPSGVLNTLPETDLVWKNALGSVTNTTASTTVASAPTITGCTLTSGASFVNGQPILINCTGGSFPGAYVRWITSLAGAVVTWAPALPQAPVATNTVKGCVNYAPASALFGSLNVAGYSNISGQSREGIGCVADVLKLDFDANEELKWELSGPMKTRQTPSTADPVTFTTVGASTLPPSGLTGNVSYGPAATATLEEFLKATFTITNGFKLDNVAFGTSSAQAAYREGKRMVEFSLDAMYSSDTSFLDAAEALQQNALVMQCGLTEGSIIAVYCPKIEIEVPDDPDEEGTMQHTFKGYALGVSGNDEIQIALA